MKVAELSSCFFLKLIFVVANLDFVINMFNKNILQKKKQLPSLKGQLGVPLTVYPWYLVCSLGILGDYNP